MTLSKVDRALARTLLRLGRTFDAHPVLKARTAACLDRHKPAAPPGIATSRRRRRRLPFCRLPPSHPAHARLSYGPPAQALVTRNHGVPLPEPLDGLVASFLGGPQRNLYWPPGEGRPAPRVAAAVLDAFRHPVRRSVDALLVGRPEP